MPLTTILANIGIIAAGISTLVLLKYTGVLDILLQGFDWVKYFISWLMENKIFAFAFFFFIIAIASSLVTFVLGLNYACTSSNQLMTQRYGVVSGLAMYMVGTNKDLNITDPLTYDSYLTNWTVPAKVYSDTSERSLMKVNCVVNDPKLMLFGRIDFLDYRYWILIMMISLLGGLIFKIKD